MELATHSRMKSRRECPLQEHYAYDLGWRLVAPPQPLTFGTAMHDAVGLRGYWAARRDGRPREALERACAHLAAPGVCRSDFERARGVAMLGVYAAYWDRRRVTVLEIEKQFRMPLYAPDGTPEPNWQRGGKMDFVLRLDDDGGRVAVNELKTSSEDASPGSAYRARLALEGQASFYVQGAASLGYAVDLVLWTVMVKPQHKPRGATPPEKLRYVDEKVKGPKVRGVPRATFRRLAKGQRLSDESPAEYLGRISSAMLREAPRYLHNVEVPRPVAVLDQHAVDLWQWCKLRDVSAALGWHPRNTDACYRHRSPCAFAPVCEGRVALGDPMLYRRAAAPHEELLDDAPAGDGGGGGDGEEFEVASGDEAGSVSMGLGPED